MAWVHVKEALLTAIGLFVLHVFDVVAWFTRWMTRLLASSAWNNVVFSTSTDNAGFCNDKTSKKLK